MMFEFISLFAKRFNVDIKRTFNFDEYFKGEGFSLMEFWDLKLCLFTKSS